MSDLEQRLRSWAEAYPEDLFPPLTDDEKTALPRGTVDRCSAAMGRHMAGILIEAAERLAELKEWIEFVRMNSKDAAHMADAALREANTVPCPDLGKDGHNHPADPCQKCFGTGRAALREGEKQ